MIIFSGTDCNYFIHEYISIKVNEFSKIYLRYISGNIYRKYLLITLFKIRMLWGVCCLLGEGGKQTHVLWKQTNTCTSGLECLLSVNGGGSLWGVIIHMYFRSKYAFALHATICCLLMIGGITCLHPQERQQTTGVCQPLNILTLHLCPRYLLTQTPVQSGFATSIIA